ncbi:IclR family transcriptional regulator [Saccharopolyspora pogona]|uniref:IclR family transcriptional regulator n=1 Tax=Saccharopolyspora pogona TaxID=333966 RepID=UPI00168A0D78|nr:IclR family transcriptional regulator [Saccharopolyspora pogona]
MNAKPPVVNSALKVLEALELICQAQQPISLEELAGALEVSGPTAYRIVNTLIETNFVKPHGYRRGYSATMKVVGLGAQYAGSFEFRDAARRAFRPVGMRFAETITVAKVDGFEAVFIDKIRVGSSLVFYCDIGRSLPLHLGAAPRCILAHLSDEEFESYLHAELVPRTTASLADPDVLRAARDQARADGFVLSVDEVDLGVSGIAVPILDPAGQILGAVAIANTSSAWTPADRAARAEAMIAAAAGMVEAMGGGTAKSAIA